MGYDILDQDYDIEDLALAGVTLGEVSGHSLEMLKLMDQYETQTEIADNLDICRSAVSKKQQAMRETPLQLLEKNGRTYERTNHGDYIVEFFSRENIDNQPLGECRDDAFNILFHRHLEDGRMFDQPERYSNYGWFDKLIENKTRQEILQKIDIFEEKGAVDIEDGYLTVTDKTRKQWEIYDWTANQISDLKIEEDYGETVTEIDGKNKRKFARNGAVQAAVYLTQETEEGVEPLHLVKELEETELQELLE